MASSGLSNVILSPVAIAGLVNAGDRRYFCIRIGDPVEKIREGVAYRALCLSSVDQAMILFVVLGLQKKIKDISTLPVACTKVDLFMHVIWCVPRWTQRV